MIGKKKDSQKDEVNDDIILENLKNVEKGKALTMPLVVLNGKFKKAYNSITDPIIQYEKSKKWRKSKKGIAYFNRSDVKAKKKAYNKAYRNRVDVKVKLKAYYLRRKLKK
jgi:hypothetical protein